MIFSTFSSWPFPTVYTKGVKIWCFYLCVIFRQKPFTQWEQNYQKVFKNIQKYDFWNRFLWNSLKNLRHFMDKNGVWWPLCSCLKCNIIAFLDEKVPGNDVIESIFVIYHRQNDWKNDKRAWSSLACLLVVVQLFGSQRWSDWRDDKNPFSDIFSTEIDFFFMTESLISCTSFHF